MTGNWLTKSINDFRHANVKQSPHINPDATSMVINPAFDFV
jgi:hypothetical protein